MYTNNVGDEKETDNVQEMRRKQIMYTNIVGDEKETDNVHKQCRR